MGWFNKEKYKFEIFKDNKKEFRFRMKAPNGEIIFQSEGYKDHNALEDTIDVIKKFAGQAKKEWV